MYYKINAVLWCLSLLYISVAAQAQSSAPMAQYPSPMQEHTRLHTRIHQQDWQGYTFEIDNLFPKPVSIYIPQKVARAASADLLIQFFGNKNVVSYAAEHYSGRLIAVTVNLGSGSSVYASPFTDTTLFDKLLHAVRDTLFSRLGHAIQMKQIIIGGFSAGYGAVRAILSVEKYREMADAVLLLDGLHASYVPDRTVLAQGGRIDSSAYTGILLFCKLAADKKSGKKFLFTHSEIFPGTFVSTTESAAFLAQELNIKPHAVLKWGPGGMQQISDVQKNNFRIMGFAGNTAPDHIDHMENLYYFLNLLKKL